LRSDEDIAAPREELTRRDRDDLICEGKLARALRRSELSEEKLSARLGISPRGLDGMLACPPRGFRERVEAALSLQPGALRFHP
jgi:hypothetical protein